MSEKSSETLMRYLNGEISVFDWLEIGEESKSQLDLETVDYLGSLLNDVDDVDDGDDDDDDDDDAGEDLGKDNDDEEAAESKVKIEVDVSQSAEDTTQQDGSPAFQVPRRMTELLLDLPAAKHVKKHGGTSVDEFLADIPISRKRKRERKKRNAIPHKLRQQMGEANILCAKGDYEKAKSICMDIIKQVPKCPEPFQTLGMVYEMQDHMEKALQFFLITAYLSKSQDVEEWMKLAGMSLEQNDYKQSLACYNQALKYEPDNISALWDRAALHYQMKELKKATDGYETILKLLPIGSPEKFFDLSVEMAMIYHEDALIEKAIEVLNTAFERHPDHLDYRAINLLAELNITSKQHSVALKNICTFCKFTQKSAEEESSGSEEPLSSFSNLLGYEVHSSPQKTKSSKSTIPSLLSKEKWVIPEDVPIDIRVKAIVCLIYLGQLHPVKTLMSPLFKEDIEEVGDLYLDIAEAYADTGEHTAALPILDTLALSPKYNQAAVWLKKAQCLMSLGRLEEAILAYNQVVTLAPNHLEARITLSSLHQQLGQPDQALDILSEKSNDAGLFTPITSKGTSSEDEPMDIEKPKDDLKPQDYRLMFHKCVLLESQNRTQDFVDAGLHLFSMYFRDVYHNVPDDDEKYRGLKLRKRSNAKPRRKKTVKIPIDNGRNERRRRIRDKRRNDKDDPGATSSRSKDDTGIRVEEWWDLLKKLITQASSIKRHRDTEHLVLCGLNSSRLTNCKDFQQELEFMSVLASCLTRKYKLAFDYVRNVINSGYIDNQVIWNILSAIVCKTEDVRHHRYCMRLLPKHPDNINLLMMNGHNAFVAGSYKFAVAEYINAFRQDPEDPLISLCLGVQYIHLACQRFPRGRHMIVVQGILFLFQYLALRGECQETYYNIGRGFHQLGLFHFAVHYYNKALECPPHLSTTNNHDRIEISDKHDLHREAAFNLSLIYRASGNSALARQILYKYITI